MKVDATPNVAPTSIADPPVAATTRTVVALAPLPVLGAAKAPPNVAARLDGASDKQLRSVLARIQEDASAKSLQLAANKLAAHARQDVRAALRALASGDTDAVGKFIATDHFDFARAALKEIAAKLPVRVVDTTKRVMDFDMGVVGGLAPIPAPPAPFEHAFEYELGQRLGAAVGLAGDVAAFLGGGGMTGLGGGVVVGSGGLGVRARSRDVRDRCRRDGAGRG
jgi:hypothetical protein